MIRSRVRRSPALGPSVAAALVTLALTACESEPTFVRGAGLATYLAAVSIDDVAGQLVPSPPPESGVGPTVALPLNADGITGGSTALDVTANAPFRTAAVWVPDAEGHYLVTLPGDVTSAMSVLTIGGRVPSLDFGVMYAVAGADGVFGPPQPLDVHAISAAGGDIQVSVTWDSQADVDLHVVEPGGTEIYYGNRTSESGELDIDANAACTTSDLRQENIGWGAGKARSGSYIVRVDYWSSCGAVQTNYIVTVSLRPGVPVVPGLPGGGIGIYRGTFTGEGTQGGAGSGVPITTFVF